MPKIGEKILKKVMLPTEGAYVVLLTNPKGDIWEDIQKEEEDTDKGALMLSKLIIEWNFTDDSGNVAPITPQTVKDALSNFDILKVQNELGMMDLLLSDAKKNTSSVTSAQTEKAVPPLNTQSSSTEKSSI